MNPTQTCERCRNLVHATTMSMFNTDIICMPCKALERAHPDYENARDAETDAIRAGDYNFPGVGLPPDLA